MPSLEERMPIAAESYRIDREDLVKYIELDLWSRFQTRLWTVVAGAVTVAAVAGVFGVPFYIKSEINQRLVKQTTEFDNRTREIFAYSKLLSLLSARYSVQLAAFHADALRLAGALEKRGTQKDGESSFIAGERSRGLIGLATRTDFADVIDERSISRHAFFLEGTEGTEQLYSPVYLTYENRGISGSGGYSEPHPVLDGSLAGALRDLRFRIVVLEALRRSMVAVERQLLTVGGATKVDNEIEAVRAGALEKDVFVASFEANLNDVAGRFLFDEDRKKFKEASVLYLLGYNVKVPDAPVPDLPKPDTRPLATQAKLQ
jgi:hypothetical protein